MSLDIIASTNVPTQVEQVSDSEGRLWYLPSVTVRTLLASGFTTFQPLILLTPEAHLDPWLTVSEAAHLLVDEEIIFKLTHDVAKSTISRACSEQKIRHQGNGRDRQIDPASLRKWILELRQKENKKADA